MIDGVPVNYLSVCSGIEAATVAWHPLGWRAIAYSEIEKFPCALLSHYYPNVPNLGDMTRFKEWPDAIPDVLVGGTPCQSFSVAGLRAGLADPRGNLMLTYLALAARYRPRWLVWENVPGVLSSWSGADETGEDHPGQDEWEADETSDFSCFLAGLEELGYGWGYRSLDAQYFDLAQRRERVFVVASLRGWQRAGAVLFERESMSGNPAPSRETREGIANSLTERPDRGGGNSEGQRLIAHALRGDGFDASEDGTGRGTPLVPHVVGTLSDGAHNGGGLNGQDAYTGRIIPILEAGARQGNNIGRESIGIGEPGDPMFTLQSSKQHAVAFAQNQRDEVRMMEVAGALPAEPGMKQSTYAHVGMRVRRLTPRECERLQGFPDDYTLVSYRGKVAADGPRYKALGNSMAVPVMRWIGERIAAVEAMDIP